jgi:hypothetical protein
MDFPQSTLEEITESERQMVLTAKERFGNHYLNARASSVFLSRCVVAVDHDRMNFGRFLALMKKHHMLALLSVVRLHKVQAMMNLRQVLEAGAAAALAIANPEDSHFFKADANGIITTPSKLAEKRSVARATFQTGVGRDQGNEGVDQPSAVPCECCQRGYRVSHYRYRRFDQCPVLRHRRRLLRESGPLARGVDSIGVDGFVLWRQCRAECD